MRTLKLYDMFHQNSVGLTRETLSPEVGRGVPGPASAGPWRRRRPWGLRPGGQVSTCLVPVVFLGPVFT